MELAGRTSGTAALAGLRHRYMGYSTLGCEDYLGTNVASADTTASREVRALSSASSASVSTGTNKRTAVPVPSDRFFVDEAALALLAPTPSVSHGVNVLDERRVMEAKDIELFEDGGEGDEASWRNAKRARDGATTHGCLPLSSLIPPPAKRMVGELAGKLRKCVACLKFSKQQRAPMIWRWRDTLTRRRRGWRKAHCD